MREHLCWAPADVHDVINTEAEAVSPAIFKAVHTASTLKVAGPIGTRFQDLLPENYASLSQEALLEEFLRPDASYRRMAVFGRSGSGKSHLIHWLKLQVPSTKDRLVVVVPKAGTSLRSILEMLITELPPERQVSFREALNRTGEAIATRKGQKERLLNEIAYALGELTPSPDGGDQDLQRELIKTLPYLFQDVHFREKHFYPDGNIVSELVDHVFAAPTAYRPAEHRRSFTQADLPIDALDFRDAAALAQNALRYLYTIPEATKVAVGLIERCLDVAVGRTLSFTGDRLVSLMEELRRHLRSEDRELVLLIEDFARVQGLDRALLQAMIVQGDDSNELCKLRWAIAVTTGFFEQVVDTVYTRVTHFVNMDRSAGRRGGDKMDPLALAEFTGPYLNAARLGARALEAWERDTPAIPLRNACTGCPQQPVCHETFGVSPQGHGLYPFTHRALWNMAHRADEQMEEAFNPRTLQTGVLLPVLNDAGPALATGQFPPASLLGKLGGHRTLDAAARRELRRLAGGEEGRLGALLELWDGSGHLVNLPAPLLGAFGAPAIPDASEAATDTEAQEFGGATVAEPVIDQRSREEKELEAWAKGGGLDKAVDKLRPLLFDAIADAIDWDDIGLERTRFCGTEGVRPFRRRSITFTRQGTRAVTSLVMLEIPGTAASAAEFDKVAIALSGLLQAEREGHWDFPGGSDALATFLHCLDGWRSEVIGQLHKLTEAREGWDHAGAAAELLAIGNVVNGRLKAEADQVADIAVLLGPEWPTEVAPGSAEMKRLYMALAQRQPELRTLLRTLCSGSKGGEVGTFVNPGVALRALRRLRANGWRLDQTPPEDLDFEPFKRCAELYKKTADALEAAAMAECAARLTWLDEMEAAFGPGAKRSTIIAEFSALRAAFADAGLAGPAAKRLDEALEALRSTQFDDALSATRGLRGAEDPLQMLPAFARARAAAVQHGRALAEAARAFLDHAESRLDEEANRHAAQAESVQADIDAIEAALMSIGSTLRALEPVDVA
ncbi:protein DpdH [Rhodospirillaceae bacterium SYSU D60014]|uniref:protein DpdH n=1 Tax=Virgifigura deserti TaxID=2268457 RepID=UPI000E66F74D